MKNNKNSNATQVSNKIEFSVWIINKYYTYLSAAFT